MIPSPPSRLEKETRKDDPFLMFTEYPMEDVFDIFEKLYDSTIKTPKTPTTSKKRKHDGGSFRGDSDDEYEYESEESVDEESEDEDTYEESEDGEYEETEDDETEDEEYEITDCEENGFV